MITTFSKKIHSAGNRIGRLVLIGALVLLVSACGKSSSDGDKENKVKLPTDTRLDLYCADVGLFNETCVLDDPDNPYARTPFAFEVVLEGEDGFNLGKFQLAADVADNPKAFFYLWATALARAPTGENQYYTALALHQLYTASQSEVIRIQTIRAYRSTLDNFFDSNTFFEADFLLTPPPEGIFFPRMTRELTAEQLAVPGANLPLFDPDDTLNNEFFARETMGGWGYTWIGMIDPDGAGPVPPASGPVYKN